jgi:hypothetical protein
MKTPYVVWFLRIVILAHLKFLLTPWLKRSAWTIDTVDQAISFVGIVVSLAALVFTFIRNKSGYYFLIGYVVFVPVFFWLIITRVLFEGFDSLSVLILVPVLAYPMVFDKYLWNSDTARNYFNVVRDAGQTNRV